MNIGRWLSHLPVALASLGILLMAILMNQWNSREPVAIVSGSGNPTATVQQGEIVGMENSDGVAVLPSPTVRPTEDSPAAQAPRLSNEETSQATHTVLQQATATRTVSTATPDQLSQSVETTIPSATQAPAPVSATATLAPTFSPTAVPPTPTETAQVVTASPISPTATVASVTSTPTITATQSTSVELQIPLDDPAWQGGAYPPTGATYAGRTAIAIYGTSTPNSVTQVTFAVDAPATAGQGELSIVGMDSEGPDKTPISIEINGTEIYNGPNPLPDNDPVLEEGTWTAYTWTFDASLLQPENNTITLRNLAPGSFGNPPWLMLDHAVVTLDVAS